MIDEDPIETCERNLVQHILRVQGEISKRMDMIEEQINGKFGGLFEVPEIVFCMKMKVCLSMHLPISILEVEFIFRKSLGLLCS